MLNNLELFGNNSWLPIKLFFDQLKVSNHLVHFFVLLIRISHFHLNFREILLEFCVGNLKGRDLVISFIINFLHFFISGFFVLGSFLESKILCPQSFLFLGGNVQISLEHRYKLIFLNPLNFLLLVGHEDIGTRLFAFCELGLKNIKFVTHQTILLFDLILLLF